MSAVYLFVSDVQQCAIDDWQAGVFRVRFEFLPQCDVFCFVSHVVVVASVPQTPTVARAKYHHSGEMSSLSLWPLATCSHGVLARVRKVMTSFRVCVFASVFLVTAAAFADNLIHHQAFSSLWAYTNIHRPRRAGSLQTARPCVCLVLCLFFSLLAHLPCFSFRLGLRARRELYAAFFSLLFGCHLTCVCF